MINRDDLSYFVDFLIGIIAISMGWATLALLALFLSKMFFGV